MEIKKIRGTELSVLILLAWLISGCVNTRKATYFNGVTDGIISANTPIPASTVQNNDLLSISISSLSPEASSFFNTNPTSSVSNENAQLNGYLVAPDGTIQLPILGSIRAEGYTTEQLKDTITNQLTDKKLLADPVVTIRFLNFRVTVLGEVNKPSVIPVPNEKISLLQAIGLAGDLTLYARRDNVLVIREDNAGNKILKRINLNNAELLTSPYYYLKSNDIIYVEPTKSRITSTGRGQQLVAVVLSGLSFAAILADRLIK
jgi:polysaccharide export outer membrane protein